MITKKKLREQINKLPEQFTIDELIEKLVFIEKVESGLNDSKNKDTISEEVLETEMKKWFA